MMMTSARNWTMINFDKNKTYTRDTKTFTGIIQQDQKSFRIDFVPIDGSTEPLKENNSWWKVWSRRK